MVQDDKSAGHRQQGLQQRPRRQNLGPKWPTHPYLLLFYYIFNEPIPRVSAALPAMEAEPDGHGANSRAQGAFFASLPPTMPPAMKTEGVGGPDPCLFCAQSGAKRLPFDEKSSASLHEAWSNRDQAHRLLAPVAPVSERTKVTLRLRNWFSEGKVNLATVAGVSGYHPECKKAYGRNSARSLTRATKGAAAASAAVSPQCGPRRSSRFAGKLSEWKRERCFLCQVGHVRHVSVPCICARMCTVVDQPRCCAFS